MTVKPLISIFVFFSLSTSLFAQSTKHPFTFEDMMKLKRVDEPVPSPDGKWVAFSATDVDLEANTKISHLWIVSASGGESETFNETAKQQERPRLFAERQSLVLGTETADPSEL